MRKDPPVGVVNTYGIPRAGTNAAGGNLCTISLCQWVKSGSCTDSNIHRGINSCSIRDALCNNDTVFLPIVVGTGGQINLQVSASKSDSLRQHQVIAKFAYRFARHIFYLQKSGAANISSPPRNRHGKAGITILVKSTKLFSSHSRNRCYRHRNRGRVQEPDRQVQAWG